VIQDLSDLQFRRLDSLGIGGTFRMFQVPLEGGMKNPSRRAAPHDGNIAGN
jgi:hypothetical protein